MKSVTAREKAIAHDSTFLVKAGNSFSLRELDRGRRIARQIRLREQDEDNVAVSHLKKQIVPIDDTVRSIVDNIGEVGCRILLNELIKVCSSKTGYGLECRKTILRVASVYVSGIQVPNLRDYDRRGSKIRVQKSSLRCCQRIVSCGVFSGSTILRQDNVIIPASDPALQAALLSGSERFLVCFGYQTVKRKA